MIPLMGIAVLAYLVVIALGLARGRVRIVEIVIGFGAFLLSLVAAILAADLFWFVVRDILLNLGVPFIGLEFPLLPIFSMVAVLVGGGGLRPGEPAGVVGGPRPGHPGLVAGGDRGDLALAARRELRVPLALTRNPGRPGRGVPGVSVRDGRSCSHRGWAPSRS